MSRCTVCCRKRSGKHGGGDGLTNPTYLSYQYLVQAQQDVMTSSEPVYELEVAADSTPASLTTAPGGDYINNDVNEYNELKDSSHCPTHGDSPGVYSNMNACSPGGVTSSPSDVTSPIYMNVVKEQQLQHRSNTEPVYSEAEPCDELAYQAPRLLARSTAAPDHCEYVASSGPV